MKDKLITFSTVSTGIFASFYFFSEDREIGRFLFVSIFTGLFAALTKNYSMKLIVNIVKRIVKPN